MTVAEFKESLSQETPPPHLDVLQQALWYEAKGDWEKAHDLAQQKNTSESAWIHAYLHRKEGDTLNAQYWYTRAGKQMPRYTLQEEWEEMVKIFTRKD